MCILHVAKQKLRASVEKCHAHEKKQNGTKLQRKR
jgi:hypothetical protein